MKAALETVALKESEATEKKETIKITQKDGSKHVYLKKLPLEWANRIQSYHAGALSDYILIAIAEKMKRDGI